MARQATQDHQDQLDLQVDQGLLQSIKDLNIPQALRPKIHTCMETSLNLVVTCTRISTSSEMLLTESDVQRVIDTLQEILVDTSKSFTQTSRLVATGLSLVENMLLMQ